MLVKICGLTDEKEALWVGEAGADFAGMVLFFNKSKRNISPDKAKAIIKALPKTTKAVAVVVSPTVEELRQIEDCGFDVIQIHGELLDDLVKTAKIEIWRAFNGDNLGELAKAVNEPKISTLLFDAAAPGSGKAFDYSSLSDLNTGDKKVFLAGGLTPLNVKEAIKIVKPDGVDTSSGVENESGFGKDKQKIIDFVANAKLI